MSAKSTGKPVTEATVEQTAAEATAGENVTEPKFKVEKLRANSMKLFNVTTSTFDGAMYGHTEPELTIKETKTIIDKWLGREE